MSPDGFRAAPSPTSFILTFYLLYTDPGYGTLIWQLWLAGVFGAMFYFRRLRELFSRRKRRGEGNQ